MGRWFAIALLSACSSVAGPPQPGSAVPGSGAAYPMKAPSPEVARAAAPFAGSCAFAKPPDELVVYDKSVVSEADAAVFASADFEAGAVNQIGVLAKGASVRAAGPVAGGHRAGAGFAILVVDNDGRVCRGYVEVKAFPSSAIGQGPSARP